MKETALTRKILSWLKEQPDVFPFKICGNRMMIAGLPDIAGNVGSRVFYMEVKIGNNKTSPIQEAIHRRIRASGGAVAVVHSLTDAQVFIYKIRENGP